MYFFPLLFHPINAFKPNMTFNLLYPFFMILFIKYWAVNDELRVY